MGSRTTDCRKFSPNIFNKSKCSHCFRQREEHSAAALECNRASRTVSKCGYLFVAPDWDFSNPLYRSKRWQRRWFMLYNDGELTYSVDDHLDTIPQACIDMTKVIEVSSAEDVTGHLNSIALTTTERVTFVKGTCSEESKWWLNILAAFPKLQNRNKRNVMYLNGQGAMNITKPVYIDQPITSKSPPTRDKLNSEEKAQTRIRNRSRNIANTKQQNHTPLTQDTKDSIHCLPIDRDRDDKLRDISTKMPLKGWTTPSLTSNIIIDEKPTRDDSTKLNSVTSKEHLQDISNIKKFVATKSTAPSIVSAIVKKKSGNTIEIIDNCSNVDMIKSSESVLTNYTANKQYERGDPDGGCNMGDLPFKYLSSNSGLWSRSDRLTSNSKKGWLLKQDSRTLDWTRHWFTLHDTTLIYYRDQIAEERCIVDGKQDISRLTSISEIAIPHNYGFQLNTWENDHIILATTSPYLRNIWMDVLKSAAGLKSINNFKNTTAVETKATFDNNINLIKNKADIEKQHIINKVMVSYNNINPTVTSQTPKSSLFSSDEEYRTASEGGRRDSIDYYSPLSTSPGLQTSISVRTKDKSRSRSSSNSRLPKRSRSSPPTSRRSTNDSVCSEGMLITHSVHDEIDNIDDLAVENRLISTETALDLLKDEAKNCETQVSGLMSTLEKTENELKKKLQKIEQSRNNLAIDFAENKNQAQDYIDRLTLELDENRKIARHLEDKLSRGIEKSENLYKKLSELEYSSHSSSICSLNKLKIKRVDSFSDLTSLNEFDPHSLDRDSLADEYNDLKSRFEKAVNEIKLMKKELKDTQNQFDTLELVHTTLTQDFKQSKLDNELQLRMMGDRIQDLASKYYVAERMARNLNTKLNKSTEKRRSISLKGREMISLPKEFEEKLHELENKIDCIDFMKKQSNSEAYSSSSIQKLSSRTRRKSLDSSPTSSDSIQVLLRLNTLEQRLNNQNGNENNSNVDTTDSVAKSNSSLNISVPESDRLKSLEVVVIAVRDRIEQSLSHINSLRSHHTRRSIPTFNDKKDYITVIQKHLLESKNLLNDSLNNCDTAEYTSNIMSETNSIKLALLQLECQLKKKLSGLIQQRRVLRERNELNTRKEIDLLAERIAFESICFGKLRESVLRAENSLDFGVKETKSELAETSQLLSLLRLKLSGRCTTTHFGGLDILANVLARRLAMTAERIGEYKFPNTSPINSDLMDELLRQQNELNIIVMRYKNNAIENVAIALAIETLNYIAVNDSVHCAVQEAWRQAQETVNTELVQWEIANVMQRHAKRFEISIAPSFGYTLTQQERISFENFSDAVQDALRKEMDIVINQLTEQYDNCLSKMKNGQWRIHLEQERRTSEGRQLLSEFADIVAHKALVDARINILKGDVASALSSSSKETLPCKDKNKSNNSDNIKFNIKTLQKYESLFTDLTQDMEISHPDDILAEADFNFMFKYYINEFTTNDTEIKNISKSLIKLESFLMDIEHSLESSNSKYHQEHWMGNNNFNHNKSSCNINSLEEITNLHDVFTKNNNLASRLEMIVKKLRKPICENCANLEKSLVEEKGFHTKELVELQAEQETNLHSIRIDLDEKSKFIELLNQEKFNLLTQLTNLENHMLNLNDRLIFLEKTLDKKNLELSEYVKQETNCKQIYINEIEKLNFYCNEYKDKYITLKMDYLKFQELFGKGKEHIKLLEDHIKLTQNENQKNEEENVNFNFFNLNQNMVTELSDKNNNFDDNNQRNRTTDEKTLRATYQAEIEQLRALCEKGLAAMEFSHRTIIGDLEEKHRVEVQELLTEKEQALAEETQATLAALDAMRKAHQNEVQREVTRFKQEFLKQFELSSDLLSEPPSEKKHELENVRVQILSLSQKYSFKCVEAASLQEKLNIASQQVKQSEQVIQQLEMRNKQLMANLPSDDFNLSLITRIASSNESSSS